MIRDGVKQDVWLEYPPGEDEADPKVCFGLVTNVSHTMASLTSDFRQVITVTTKVQLTVEQYHRLSNHINASQFIMDASQMNTRGVVIYTTKLAHDFFSVSQYQCIVTEIEKRADQMGYDGDLKLRGRKNREIADAIGNGETW